ncbi:LacI family DNA-binding transcriptional regulator [Sphingomonas psychrotolerans]|nr:LacI family DNA-binding transcriptional regulator [Sphingomonas psychrotolerans]
MREKEGTTHPGPPRPATLRDVAQRAGVSMMTVSRVLNSEVAVRPRTRAIVEQAVRELNYIPNSTAKALAFTRQAHRIAFLFDAPNATILGDMVGSVMEEPSRPDIKLIFLRVRSDDDPLQTLANMKTLGVDGAILSPPLCDDARLRIVLTGAGIRILAIGCSDEDPSLSTIGIDDTRAAFELTTYLLKLGHRRIGLIAGHARHRSSGRRRAGFEAALVEFGLVSDPALQWEGDYTFGTAIGIAEQALSLRPPPTAIFASNDDMGGSGDQRGAWTRNRDSPIAFGLWIRRQRNRADAVSRN